MADSRRPRRDRFARALAAQLGFLALAAPASAADPETSRLSYLVRAHGVACPDETSFRNLVAARLGYDPFDSTGRHDASVELVQEGDRLRGRARVTREGSSTAGVRELAVGINECDALAAALATAVAIALDPLRPPPAPDVEALPELPPPVSPPAPPPVVPQPARPAPPSAVRAPDPVPVSLFGRAAGALSFGEAPALALGSEIGVGLRRRWLSIEALGRFETMPGTMRTTSGERLEATIVAGGLMPCVHHQAGWFGCVQARLGALQGRAPDVVMPSLGSSLCGALGLRGGYALELSPVFTLSATVEGALQLVRTSLLIDGRAVWTAPPILGGLQVNLLVTLL